MNKKLKYLVSIIISISILTIIYRKINLTELIPFFKEINDIPFAVFVLLILLQLLIASARWRKLLDVYSNKKMSLYKASQYVIGSYSANLIIPAKMGEVVRVAWEKDKEKRKETFQLVLFEKLLDISSIYLIFILSLLFVIQTTERLWLFVIIGVTPVVGLLIVFFIFKSTNLVQKLPLKVTSFLDFYTNNITIKSQIFYRFMLVSILLWIIQIAQFYFIFLAFGIHLPILESFAGNSLAVLAGAFVPSIGGVGPRDATIIWFFKTAAGSLPLTAIGAVSALRIIIPAIIGLPFFFNLTRKI